jgi:hypothetical protein
MAEDARRRRQRRQRRRRAPQLLLPFVAFLAFLALCSCTRLPLLASAASSADTLTSQIPALATPEGSAYLAALPASTVASLAAGVEAMTSERKASLASMSLDAVRRVFAAATAAAGSEEAAAAAAAATTATPAPPVVAAAAATSTTTPAKGRAAALAALAAKGLNNDDGLLDEPSLKTLRALATLPEARLREFASLGTDARAAALSFFADGVGACSAKGVAGGAATPM